MALNRTWKHLLQVFVAWRAAAQRSAHHRSVLAVAAACLRNSLVARAWGRWRLAAQERRQLRARLAETLYCWQHRAQSAAFAQWREAAAGQAARKRVLMVSFQVFPLVLIKMFVSICSSSWLVCPLCTRLCRACRAGTAIDHNAHSSPLFAGRPAAAAQPAAGRRLGRLAGLHGRGAAPPAAGQQSCQFLQRNCSQPGFLHLAGGRSRAARRDAGGQRS